jgi:hypothetical protein
LIDDDPDVTLKTVLENDGYVVDIFNDPIMALEHFKKVMTLLVRQVKKEVRNTVLFLLISECQV